MSAHTFWDREVSEPKHTSWMEDPLVRASIGWPVEWFAQQLKGRRFARAISIGCGTGPLERDLIRKNLIDRIDAFDGSTNSLRIAQRAARDEGMSSRVHYFAADFNRPALPRDTYDAVFIHQALHHVEKIEKLLRAILFTLKPGGVLYLDEYIGPSRHDWNESLLAPHRAIYDKLPRSSRRGGTLGPPFEREDPSEAIRSSEILPQLRIGFDIRETRGYGGNLLAVLHPFVTQDAIAQILEEEQRLLKTGATPYYAVIIATPKQGIKKRIATTRYFLEPKLKRVVRAGLGPGA